MSPLLSVKGVFRLCIRPLINDKFSSFTFYLLLKSSAEKYRVLASSEPSTNLVNADSEASLSTVPHLVTSLPHKEWEVALRIYNEIQQVTKKKAHASDGQQQLSNNCKVVRFNSRDEALNSLSIVMCSLSHVSTETNCSSLFTICNYVISFLSFRLIVTDFFFFRFLEDLLKSCGL